MSFVITHAQGDMEGDPAPGWIDPLIGELDHPDREHPDVAVAHESGWSLSAFPSGLVVWQNVETDDPERRHHLTRLELREVFEAVAAGDLPRVETLLARGRPPEAAL